MYSININHSGSKNFYKSTILSFDQSVSEIQNIPKLYKSCGIFIQIQL